MSKATTPSAAGVPDQPLPVGPVSVGAILERQVAFEWYESVAIVSGICSAIDPGDAEIVPAWHDCLLTPEGTIVVREGARPNTPVGELPRLLHALLDGAATPAPLRLFVVHAISSNSHRPARSFGEALAYHDRPNRTENLQAAYQRYLETPAERHREPPPIPEPEPEQPEVAVRPVRANARARRARMAVAAVLICASVAGIVIARRMGPAGSDAPAGLAALASHVGDAAMAVGGSLFGLGNGEMSRVAGAADPEPPRARRTARPSISRPSPVHAPRIDTDRIEPRAIAMLEQPVVAAEAAAPTTPDVSLEAIVYTSESTDVVAPVLVDPVRLPAAVRTAGRSTGAVMELIITDTGTVERARFLTPPERMTDIMLLSAAKTWQFRPGMKDGRPVPYRVITDWLSLR